MNKLWLVALIATCIFSSCTNDDDAGKPANGILQLSVTGLPDLGDNYRYQAWVTKDGTMESAGIFTVDPTAVPFRKNLPVERTKLVGATKVTVTVEPFPDTDAAPSTIKVLAGDFVADNVVLSTVHPDVLGVDFAGLSGNYLLLTPTTPSTNDEMRGLWFANVSNGTDYSAGLNTLPSLSSAWRYEGWVFINGQPVSIGKFQNPGMPDQSNRYSGTGPALLFPGEDFITSPPAGISFPQSLAGSQVLISVEPADDTNENAPFMMQPFKTQVISSALPNTNYTIASQAEQGMPKGTATR